MLPKHEYLDNICIRNIHVSRYAASWMNKGGTFKTHNDRHRFRLWLKQLKINGSYLDPEEVQYIFGMCTNGKLELEENVEKFLSNN